MTLSHATNSILRIVGLAIITFILAGIILFFFPKFSNAPKPDGKETVLTQTPTTSPSITFDNLSNNARVQAGQLITGKVVGRWFFEGSFPVTLRDIHGNTFTTAIATTNEDWMVTNRVTFSLPLPSAFIYTGVGSMLFKKDDPSDGEATFDPAIDELIVPVIFENQE